MKFVIVILLVVCVELFLGSPTINKNNWNYWNAKQPFCGSKLAIEMAMICKGRYNPDPRSQKPKIKRGIVDECCTFPCTRKFLKDFYCAPELTTSNPKSKIAETTASTTTTTTTTTTESIRKEFPVDYTSYYYALIGRVKADPEDYARHGKTV